MNRPPVITIDGPGGTGKGTLAVYLARRLDWHLLDSGVLYRILAYAAGKAGVALEDSTAVAALAAMLKVEFALPAGEDLLRVVLAGEDISEYIRAEECGSAASVIAAVAEVRQALLQWQQDFRQPPGLVADGRDMGTVVFPDAGLKIYLTASPEERAKRRYKQLNAKGISVNLQRLSTDISRRDARDMERKVSPLLPAEDAVVIDTTASDIAGVTQTVWQLVEEKFNLNQ